MFYRLTRIGDDPLPGLLAFNDRSRVVVEGGLLLVAEGTRRPGPAGIGDAILSMSGPPCPDGSPGWALTLNAPYRWTAAGHLALTRDDDLQRPQFVGARDGGTLVLRPTAGALIAVGDLTFVEASHEPIPDGWQRLFWGGPRSPFPRQTGESAEERRVRAQRFVAEAWEVEGAESNRQLAAAWCASA